MDQMDPDYAEYSEDDLDSFDNDAGSYETDFTVQESGCFEERVDEAELYYNNGERECQA